MFGLDVPSLTRWLAPCISPPKSPHQRNLGEKAPLFYAAGTPRSAPRPLSSRPEPQTPGHHGTSRTSNQHSIRAFHPPLPLKKEKKKGKTQWAPVRAGIGSRSARGALAPLPMKICPLTEPSESGSETQGCPPQNPALWEKSSRSGRPVGSVAGPIRIRNHSWITEETGERQDGKRRSGRLSRAALPALGLTSRSRPLATDLASRPGRHLRGS